MLTYQLLIFIKIIVNSLAINYTFENIFDSHIDTMNKNRSSEIAEILKERESFLIVLEFNKKNCTLNMLRENIYSLIKIFEDIILDDEFFFSAFRPFKNLDHKINRNFYRVLLNRLRYCFEFNKRFNYKLDDNFFFTFLKYKLKDIIEDNFEKEILSHENNFILIDNYIKNLNDLGIILRKLSALKLSFEDLHKNFIIISLSIDYTNKIKSLKKRFADFLMANFEQEIFYKKIDNIVLSYEKGNFSFKPNLIKNLHNHSTIEINIEPKIENESIFYLYGTAKPLSECFIQSIYFSLYVYQFENLPAIILNFFNHTFNNILSIKSKVLILRDFLTEIQIYVYAVHQNYDHNYIKCTIFLCTYLQKIQIFHSYTYLINHQSKACNFEEVENNNGYIKPFNLTIFLNNIDWCLKRKLFNIDCLPLNINSFMYQNFLIPYQTSRVKEFKEATKFKALNSIFIDFCEKLPLKDIEIINLSISEYFYNKEMYYSDAFQPIYGTDKTFYINRYKYIDKIEFKNYDRLCFTITVKIEKFSCKYYLYVSTYEFLYQKFIKYFNYNKRLQFLDTMKNNYFSRINMSKYDAYNQNLYDTALNIFESMSSLEIFISITDNTNLQFSYLEKIYLNVLKKQQNINYLSNFFDNNLLSEIENIEKLIAFRESKIDAGNYLFEKNAKLFEKYKYIVKEVINLLNSTFFILRYEFYIKMQYFDYIDIIFTLKKSIDFIKRDHSNDILRCFTECILHQRRINHNVLK
ncbi:hypothetical protein GVAV_000232 [Gurleya vavrai]